RAARGHAHDAHRSRNRAAARGRSRQAAERPALSRQPLRSGRADDRGDGVVDDGDAGVLRAGPAGDTGGSAGGVAFGIMAHPMANGSWLMAYGKMAVHRPYAISP